MGTNPETTTGTSVTITDVTKCRLYYLNELPEADQKEFDWYYSNPEDCGMQFFAYKGEWYDLSQLPTLSSFGADISGTYNVVDRLYGDEDCYHIAIEWHAMASDTWCSGIVVNTDPICFEDAVYVGRWTS